MNNTKHSHSLCVDHNNWWRHGTCGTQQLICQAWFIFTRPCRTKISSNATLKGIMLRYPTAWRDFPLRNAMSTVSWKIWSLRFPTLGVKNVPLIILRTVFQLCWDQLQTAKMLVIWYAIIVPVMILCIYTLYSIPELILFEIYLRTNNLEFRYLCCYRC